MRQILAVGVLLASFLLFSAGLTSSAVAAGESGAANQPTVSAPMTQNDSAAQQTGERDPFAFILLELALLIGMVIAARWLADHFKQPAVLGELVIGVALGNIGYWLGLPFFSFVMDYGIASPLFDQVWRSGASVVEAASHIFGPQELAPGGKGYEVVHLMTGSGGLTNVNIGVSLWLFSSLGIVLLLFNIGLETSVAQLRRVGLQASLVAVIGVLATFILGLAATLWLLNNYPPTARVFLAATLCATSIGISTRVFKDLHKQDTPEASIILGACVLNDLLGLVLLAVCIELVLKGHIEPLEIVWIIVMSSVFLGAIVFLGDRLGNRFSSLLNALKRNETRFLLPLAMAFMMGWFASQIGLSEIVGGFAAGLILSDESLKTTMKNLLMPLVSIFTPIFFLLIGMQVNLAAFLHWQTLALTVLLVVVAVAGKLLAGFAAGAGVDRLIVGLGMLPRGEVALIFASLGKALGVIDSTAFAALIIVIIVMAFATTVALRWSFARPPAIASADG